jgi:hypothetical protein
MLNVPPSQSCSVSLLAALLCSLLLLLLLADVKAFQHNNLGKGPYDHRIRRTTTLTLCDKDDNTEPFSSLPISQQHRQSLGKTSYRSTLYRANANDSEHIAIPSWWRSFLLAASVILSTVSNEPPLAYASLDISPGTTVFEISPQLTQQKFLLSTTGTALQVTQTAFADRNDLFQSLRRLQSAAAAEFTSTEAWQDVWAIIQKYGLDLKKQISIRPPADLRRTLQYMVQEGKVNFIINGQVVQVSLEYSSGKDAIDATKRQEGDSSQQSDGDATVVTPDDEWILKVQGYRGIDPTTIDVALQTPSFGARLPLWARNFWEYCTKPYPEKYLSDFLIPTKEGQRPVTYGDILVLEGSLAVGFLYAWAYAYYLDEIEKAEKATSIKAGIQKKKEGALKQKEFNTPVTATKQGFVKKASTSSTAPVTAVVAVRGDEKSSGTKSNPIDTSSTILVTDVAEKPGIAVMATRGEETIQEEAESVKVSIDFDSTGQMVITATEKESRDGLWSLLQALYFPWLGMLVPSLTAPDTVVIISSNDKEETEGFFPFLRALYMPWLGILQGK